MTVSEHNVKFSHVIGHRDEELPERELIRMEKLNVRADQLAEQGRNSTTLQPYVPGYRPMLSIAGTPITTEYAELVRHAYHSPAIAQYYVHKYQWHMKVMDTIDWDALHSAMKNVSTIRQTRMLKLLHDWNLMTKDCF